MTGQRAKGEGSIYRRKSSGWAGQFTDGNKRRYVYGKTKKEVADKLKAAIAERDAGRDFEADNATLAEYLNRWLDDVRDTVRPQTLESYALHVRRHIGPVLGHVKLKNLTPGDVQGFYREKLDTGLSARSVEYSHVVLNRALKQAVKRGAVSRNQTEAAEQAGVSRSTVVRPLANPNFQEAYRALKRASVEHAATRAQSTLDKAQDALDEILDKPCPPNVKLTAIKTAFDFALKTSEFEGLDADGQREQNNRTMRRAA